MNEVELLEKAQKVLKQNDRGKWTVPAGDLYPHQWLWDSCFIAIGLRHLDIERAQTELKSLLRGQWSNGMIPHMIFDLSADDKKPRERERSYLSPHAPHDIATSGITQPPMIAEAVVQIGQKLKMPERRTWYREMYSGLLRHHEWLYANRDPHKEGLIILLHPYECGLDNTPPWISELRKHSMPLWVRLIERLHLDGVANLVRRDTRHVPPGQRMSNIEAMAYWAAMRRLRRKAYNSEAILSRSLFAVEDLAFNCILIRGNAHLKTIAKDIGHRLPDDLIQKMAKTESALEQLWDERTGQYYSRSFVSHKLIEEPSIATLLPLYAGNTSHERAEHLVKLLKSKKEFGLRWPVPSVPQSSDFFDPLRYWQGPTWVNTNWLIIEGLKSYGFDDEAKLLHEQTLELVAKSGMNEYFSPIDGIPGGASNFSWTAALTIDLLK
ncbi:MAG TPA: trehalase family glycosidase [Candidatus Saccharimonadales bacterium]|nr:trehalase family glycosidase [Candidatus Saccharimonadales bacterium]